MSSVAVYNNIVSRLPDDLVNLINEFVNPETTYYEERVKEISVNLGLVFYSRCVSLKSNNDLKLDNRLISPESIKELQTFLKVIPHLYNHSNKPLIEKYGFSPYYLKNVLKYECYKSLYPNIHHIELSNNQQLNYSLVIIAMVMSGFKYILKDINNNKNEAYIYFYVEKNKNNDIRGDKNFKPYSNFLNCILNTNDNIVIQLKYDIYNSNCKNLFIKDDGAKCGKCQLCKSIDASNGLSCLKINKKHKKNYENITFLLCDNCIIFIENFYIKINYFIYKNQKYKFLTTPPDSFNINDLKQIEDNDKLINELKNIYFYSFIENIIT